MKRRHSFALLVFLALLGWFAAAPVFSASVEYTRNWKTYMKENQPAGDKWTWNEVADAIEKVLVAGEQMMDQGDYAGARQAASDGYYGYYDSNGFEDLVHGISGARVSQTELQFSTIRTIAKSQGSADAYRAEADKLVQMLREDADKLDGVSRAAKQDAAATTGTATSGTSSTSGGGSAAALIFAACFGIILREGFEAIIVVGAIIAYVQVKAKHTKSDKRKTVYPVYVGSLLGIVASFLTAWLLNLLRLAKSSNQEVIEGITALIAVCVLFYVCNWMLHKSETEAWTKYLESKTSAASEKGSTFALAFTAFLAVFREGAEVVLFFQPYLNGENTGAVVGGLVLGAIALVFVYLIIHVLSVNIPIRPFFTATSILMAVMCVSFLGAGIKELIEGGSLSAHSPVWLQWIPYNNVLDVLGIYPMLETIIPQIVMAVVLIVIFRIQFRKNRELRREAEARKQAEETARLAKERKEKDEALRAEIREVVLEVLKEQQ